MIFCFSISKNICLLQRRVQDLFHQGQISFLGGAEIFSSGQNYTIWNFIRGLLRGGHMPLLISFIRGICPTARHATVLLSFQNINPNYLVQFIRKDHSIDFEYSPKFLSREPSNKRFIHCRLDKVSFKRKLSTHMTLISNSPFNVARSFFGKYKNCSTTSNYYGFSCDKICALNIFWE